jgi:hypothetical protein
MLKIGMILILFNEIIIKKKKRVKLIDKILKRRDEI